MWTAAMGHQWIFRSQDIEPCFPSNRFSIVRQSEAIGSQRSAIGTHGLALNQLQRHARSMAARFLLLQLDLGQGGRAWVSSLASSAILLARPARCRATELTTSARKAMAVATSSL